MQEALVVVAHCLQAKHESRVGLLRSRMYGSGVVQAAGAGLIVGLAAAWASVSMFRLATDLDPWLCV